MKGPWEYVPIPPAPPGKFLADTPWAMELKSKLPIGREVEVYHRGRIRKGRIEALAPKATISHQKVYVWVKFDDPDIVGTVYGSKLAPLDQLP